MKRANVDDLGPTVGAATVAGDLALLKGAVQNSTDVIHPVVWGYPQPVDWFARVVRELSPDRALRAQKGERSARFVLRVARDR